MPCCAPRRLALIDSEPPPTRYLRDVPGRQHPVVFALFDQEELGLIGSKAYVPTLATTDVASVHIFDMLSFDGDGDHAVELWSPSACTRGRVPAVWRGGWDAGLGGDVRV